MKKSVALAIAAAMSLSVAGTALANNPFSDVPQGHWAYDAVAQLEKDGLITGYGDGTYRGDRAMTRYEMATVVAQLDDAVGENAELINRLRSEFATELYNLGVRVDKLEKGASTIKFTGDARIRYVENGGSLYLISIKEDLESRKAHMFEQRVRVNMDANINENVKFKGRINYTNISNFKNVDLDDSDRYSWSRDVWLDRAEIQWTSGSFEGRFGRTTPTLGQGLIWYDNPADGALIGYKTDKWDIFGGVLDYSPMIGDSILIGHGDVNTVGSANATVANIGYKFNDNFSMTAAYSNMHGDFTAFGYTDDEIPSFELMAFGFNAKLSDKWGLVGEYIKNNADYLHPHYEDDGYWVRATYGKDDMNKKGSYSIYAEYLDFGAGSIDAFAYGHILDTPGSSWGIGGAKGYGIGLTYVPAKNINMQFIFHDLEPASKWVEYDGANYRNSYQFVTNFRF